MWFRSAKSFKEDPENLTLLMVLSRFTLFSFKTIERAENQYWKENFIDALLKEPIIPKKPINIIWMDNYSKFN